MAKALNGHALETYNRRLSFNAETRKMIELIRSSSPSRNPHGNKSNVRVRYPCKKMSSIIKAESRRIELPGLLEAEYDDDVLEYFDQSPLSWAVDGDLLNEFLGRE